ncbi:hypothetical protein ACVLD2_001375 [Paenibacillus sp. PvR052]
MEDNGVLERTAYIRRLSLKSSKIRRAKDTILRQMIKEMKLWAAKGYTQAADE